MSDIKEETAAGDVPDEAQTATDSKAPLSKA